MAVHFEGFPAEATPFVHHGFHGENVIGGPAALVMIVIQDYHQIVQSARRAEQGRFPDDSLLHFPVADNGIDRRRIPGCFESQRNACGYSHPVSEGTGRHVHSRGFFHVRVSLQTAVDFAHGEQFLARKKALLGKRCIQHGAGMPLGKYEAVALLPLRLVRPDAHQIEIQAAHDVRQRKRRPRMRRALGFVGNVNDIPAQLTGHACKPVDSVIHKPTYFPNVNTGLNMNTNRISVLPVLRT